ncbi:MAG: hypothetical protein Q8W49_11685 [Candidatus Palauibacterales bacterium]|nr:hypothetical protein [Candidatus Palauibacterales bacterium]
MDERVPGGDRAAPASGRESPRRDGRGRVVAGLFLALAVLVGLLGGIVIDRALLAPPVAAVAAGTPLPLADTGATALAPDTAGPAQAGDTAVAPEAPSGGRVLAWMADSLDLSPEQRVRIAAVVRDEQRRARELTVRVRPRYQQVLRRTRLRVLAILTSEQRIRLRHLLAERRAVRGGRDSTARRRRP